MSCKPRWRLTFKSSYCGSSLPARAIAVFIDRGPQPRLRYHCQFPTGLLLVPELGRGLSRTGLVPSVILPVTGDPWSQPFFDKAC